ncbi:hypothetical protein EDB84DRAFT_1619417, partial [Lactarius hengduanensis]
MAPCRYAVSVSSVSMGHGAASVSKCHSTVSLRCVGVVGVEGPRRRVVTARRCRWATAPRRCQRAMAPCCYAVWVSSVSMGHDAVSLRRGHGTASVSKGHGAVLLRRVGVVGVDGPRRRVVGARRCRWATAPRGCRRVTAPCRYATTPRGCRWATAPRGCRRATMPRGCRRAATPRECRTAKVPRAARWNLRQLFKT